MSDYPQFKSLLDFVFDEMKSQGLGYIQKAYNHRLRDNLRIVLLNLCHAHLCDPEKTVRYFRDKNKYVKGTVLHKLHIKYSYVVGRVIPYLKTNGYIEDWGGQYFKDSQYASRMRATSKLMDMVQREHKLTLPMIRRNLPENRLVVLRDENGKEIDYEDTPETLKMKENLKLINEVLESNVILVKITDSELADLNNQLIYSHDSEVSRGGSIDFTQTSLWRVFNNGSWSQGGRFYGGWWQRVINREDIEKDYRKYITINGLPTGELDYSGLHINMLYALEKLPPPENDVYHLNGYSNTPEFRKFAKRMLLVMVNASDRSTVRQALHKEVYVEHRLKLPFDIKSTSRADIYPMMDAFELKHAPIKKYFCTGKGIYLQHLDSKLAEAIMLSFANQKTPCLPVHDSFIVDFGHILSLLQAMQDEFLKQLDQEGKVSFKRKIKASINEVLIRALIESCQWFKDSQKEMEEKNYSQYNKMLKEFAEAKNVIVGNPKAGFLPRERLLTLKDDLIKCKSLIFDIEKIKRFFSF